MRAPCPMPAPSPTQAQRARAAYRGCEAASATWTAGVGRVRCRKATGCAPSPPRDRARCGSAARVARSSAGRRPGSKERSARSRRTESSDYTLARPTTYGPRRRRRSCISTARVGQRSPMSPRRRTSSSTLWWAHSTARSTSQDRHRAPASSPGSREMRGATPTFRPASTSTGSGHTTSLTRMQRRGRGASSSTGTATSGTRNP